MDLKIWCENLSHLCNFDAIFSILMRESRGIAAWSDPWHVPHATFSTQTYIISFHRHSPISRAILLYQETYITSMEDVSGGGGGGIFPRKFSRGVPNLRVSVSKACSIKSRQISGHLVPCPVRTHSSVIRYIRAIQSCVNIAKQHQCTYRYATPMRIRNISTFEIKSRMSYSQL